jgi:hypothetical protein
MKTFLIRPVQIPMWVVLCLVFSWVLEVIDRISHDGWRNTVVWLVIGVIVGTALVAWEARANRTQPPA